MGMLVIPIEIPDIAPMGVWKLRWSRTKLALFLRVSKISSHVWHHWAAKFTPRLSLRSGRSRYLRIGSQKTCGSPQFSWISIQIPSVHIKSFTNKWSQICVPTTKSWFLGVLNVSNTEENMVVVLGGSWFLVFQSKCPISKWKLSQLWTSISSWFPSYKPSFLHF